MLICNQTTVKFFLLILVLDGCNNCNTNTSPPSSKLGGNSNVPRELHESESLGPTSGKLFLKASQAIAADLSAAKELQPQYQHLRPRIGIQAGYNLHATFVGIAGMKNALRVRPNAGEGDLSKFMSWAESGDWKQFGPAYHHYDWWMFPIDRSSQGQGFLYTVYQDDIQKLQADLDWLKDYRLGAILLMQSWGWDVKNKKSYASPASGQMWRNWGVRLGKLGHSLILFEQWDLYSSLKDYVTYLTQSGVNLETWILSYFSDN